MNFLTHKGVHRKIVGVGLGVKFYPNQTNQPDDIGCIQENRLNDCIHDSAHAMVLRISGFRGVRYSDTIQYRVYV